MILVELYEKGDNMNNHYMYLDSKIIYFKTTADKYILLEKKVGNKIAINLTLRNTTVVEKKNKTILYSNNK